MHTPCWWYLEENMGAHSEMVTRFINVNIQFTSAVVLLSLIVLLLEVCCYLPRIMFVALRMQPCQPTSPRVSNFALSICTWSIPSIHTFTSNANPKMTFTGKTVQL